MSRVLPALIALLILPASAQADSFGSDVSQTPAVGCTKACSAFTKTTAGGDPNRGAPFDGALTKIRLRHAGPATSASIIVIRRTGTPNRFLNVAEVGIKLPAVSDPAGAIFELSGSLPIMRGDRLGIRLAKAPAAELKFAASGGERQCVVTFKPHAEGTEADYDDCKSEVLIEGTVEPDADTDGTPDASDSDDDNDTILDDADNCTASPNLGQGDAEKDGLGDPCDEDDDNDRLTDLVEQRKTKTSPIDADSDDDGLADGAERKTDPLRFDTDGDHLGDGLERGVTKPVPNPPGRALGTDTREFEADQDPATRTNPRRRDSDRDGRADNREDRNENGRVDRGETDPRKRDG